jgi:hypothetical protein
VAEDDALLGSARDLELEKEVWDAAPLRNGFGGRSRPAGLAPCSPSDSSELEEVFVDEFLDELAECGRNKPIFCAKVRRSSDRPSA